MRWETRVCIRASMVSACACVIVPAFTAAASAVLRAARASDATLSAVTPFADAMSANDLPAARCV